MSASQGTSFLCPYPDGLKTSGSRQGAASHHSTREVDSVTSPVDVSWKTTPAIFAPGGRTPRKEEAIPVAEKTPGPPPDYRVRSVRP